MLANLLTDDEVKVIGVLLGGRVCTHGWNNRIEAVEKVAKKKSLAAVFDKSGDLTLLYTNPAHDYTEFVLEELGLGAEDRNQPGPKGAVKTVAPPKTPVDPNFESDSGTSEPATSTPPAIKSKAPAKKSRK